MDIIKSIIYEQNRELLQRIANDKYNHDDEKKKLMGKY